MNEFCYVLSPSKQTDTPSLCVIWDKGYKKGVFVSSDIAEVRRNMDSLSTSHFNSKYGVYRIQFIEGDDVIGEATQS